MQSHEKRCAMLPAQGKQVVQNGLFDPAAYRPADKRLPRRARPVQRQAMYCRYAAQLPFPVGTLAFEFFADQVFALPLRVIGILDRQWRQRIGLCAQPRLVKRCKFTQEDGHGPAIRRDVMQRRKQDMFLRCQLDDGDAQHRVARQIKRLAGLRSRQGIQFFVQHLGSKLRVID